MSGCPMHQSSDRARAFDPFGPAFQSDPPGALAWARDGEPVFYSEVLNYWVVTRYADIKAVFRDNLTFSASVALEKMVPPTAEAVEILKTYAFDLRKTLVNEDEPIHMERRRALLDAFSPAALESHEAMVRALVRDRVDAIIDTGEADLVKALLWEVPLTVALHFLGVPESDMGKLREFSVAHTLNVWGKPSDDEQAELAHGVGRFWAYCGAVLERMKANPDGHGWMHDMIRANREIPEIVTDNYLHSMLMAIIVAAHETTALAGANMMRRMLGDRAAWRAVCRNPDLIPNAVEECLRHSGSQVAWRRVTTTDTTVGGVPIPKGARLLIVSASGNHDPRQFENPDALDLWRDNAASHLTFGYGAHQCMGKNLGRMELRVMLEELTRRLPHMALQDQTFHALPNVSFYGVDRVLVHWDPAQNPERRNPALRAGTRRFPIGAPDVRVLTRALRVARLAPVAEGVLGLTLEDPEGAPLPPWSPGAHIDLHLPGDLTRKYSLCGENGAWSLAILREDQGRGGSRWIHDSLRAGDIVHTRGPRNHFRLDDSAPAHVLIAGGIGITPILAMADHLRDRPHALHYAGRSRAGMALLERVSRDHPGAHLWIGDEGRRMDLPALIAAAPPGAQVCVCGPARLIQGVEAACAARPDLILTFEHFDPVDTALDPDRDHAFTVELLDSDLTLTVPATRSLLDVLHETGIDVPCDCGEGLCGTCEIEVADGGIDHRDRVLTRTERAEGRRMMACCSRAAGDRLKVRL